MSIKALSQLFALSSLSALGLVVACSEPPAPSNPPANSGGNTSGGTGTTAGTPGGGAGTTAGTPSGGAGTTAGSGGAGTTGGTGGTPGNTGGGGAGTTGGMGPEAPPRPGFTNVINENFDAPIDLDTHPIWTWSDGGLNEGQVRFTKEAITFADGKMKITTSKPAAPIPGGQSYAENTANLKAFPLQSGEFRTKHNNYRYGYYEVSMKAPKPNPANPNGGNFISTLFVFRTPKIEDWREIDIEVTGGSNAQLMTNMVHGQGVGDYGQTQNKAIQTPQITPPAGFNTMDNFNTYAFEWRADSIKWFVNDQQVRQEPMGNAPPIPQMSAKIMMSQWVFNESYAFGGPDGEENMYPFTVEYEFFRFYKLDGEEYPMDPAALPATDKNASKNNATETDTQG